MLLVKACFADSDYFFFHFWKISTHTSRAYLRENSPAARASVRLSNSLVSNEKAVTSEELKDQQKSNGHLGTPCLMPCKSRNFKKNTPIAEKGSYSMDFRMLRLNSS
jgi:hypothetical protein